MAGGGLSCERVGRLRAEASNLAFGQVWNGRIKREDGNCVGLRKKKKKTFI